MQFMNMNWLMINWFKQLGETRCKLNNTTRRTTHANILSSMVDWSYAIYEYELVDDVEETDNENNINV